MCVGTVFWMIVRLRIASEHQKYTYLKGSSWGGHKILLPFEDQLLTHEMW